MTSLLKPEETEEKVPLAREDVNLDVIREAAERIRGFAYRTPTYRCFSEQNIFLKLECYQPVRSFKIRGASNKILSIPEEERKKKGVITASSGNHGLAVAYVANRLEIGATIVVPETVIPDKLEMIKSLGARAILYGRQQDERARKADEIASKEGQIFVQPFNDTKVVAGQATCGLEIIEDVPDADSIFVPIGGGGLIAGVASAVKLSQKRGETPKVIGVQPEGSPSMFNSWKAGRLSEISESRTIADGLSVRKPGDITFSIVKKFVDEIVLVSDDEIVDATKKLLQKEHVLAEPSGAAAFAAALRSKKRPDETAKSVAIVSGGNASREVILKVLSS
jgi:threonine dehydratase